MGHPAFNRGAMMASNTSPGNLLGQYTIDAEVHRRMQMAAQMQSGTLGNPYTSQPYLDLKQMIFMRLHMSVGELIPFEFLEAHRSGETVHVFVVVNGQPVTLSDGHTLFPSDDLITKLNLLR